MLAISDGGSRATGLEEYRATPGNLGCQMLLRPLGDGSTEVTTLSWWRSMEAIRGFAGDDAERAVYYPEDERFLLERPLTVEHHRVLASELQPVRVTSPASS